MLRFIITIFLSCSLFQNITAAQTKLLLVGDKIQKHIYINTHFIAENSDTLILNNTILQRNADYRFNKKFKRFELLFEHTSDSDSLIVVYRLLPNWLQQRYGQALPEITPKTKTSTIVFPTKSKRLKSTESDITLGGSKSFRFSSSKSGNAGFNQTLDLNLSGHLAKNLTLKGTISDRGYNPSYGTSNSRLNELDKINLKVESPNFLAQIGDIVLRGTKNSGIREKKISGLDMSVHNKNMRLGITAARPKGQYNSVSFLGSENKQGPYQIKSQGARLAIIPGSETVWLDGVELKRGAKDDYTLDYPNGQITFDVSHKIDNRSRIVIDYEPLSSDYKQEYLQTHTQIFSTDTTFSFNFGWIREGDDKNENLSQTFTISDEQLLANLSGEDMIYKSGLLSDTLGSYNILSDSLPDTVYQYAGENVGQYDVRFSFVDSGNGAYIYLGGSQYQYVGSSNGDYLPIILLYTPKRTDYLQSSFTIDKNKIGILQTEWRQSRKKNNLFALDDNSIQKNYYHFTYDNSFLKSKNKINAQYSRKEFGYQERNRVNQADYAYQFYLPAMSQFFADEELSSVSAFIQAHHSLSIKPQFSLLNYSGQFNAKKQSVIVRYTPYKKLTLSGEMHSVKTDLTNLSDMRHGKSNDVYFKSTYNVYKKYNIISWYKKTERTNNYDDTLNGFAHDAYQIQFADRHSEISYQYYTEDTLSLTWKKQKNRKRIQLKSENRLYQIDYTLQMYYQQTDNLTGKESSLLTRGNFIYSNRKHNVQIQSSYMLSDETRFSKGIRYLEVNDGEGDYIFSDSQFIPESGGNYILVEELLSESAPVKRGEKSFSLSKKWSNVYLRFNSIINEELFASESRRAEWIIPFYSDANLSYLFFSRTLKGTLKSFPIKGGYAFTLNFSDKRENRFINLRNRLKKSLNSEVILNQNVQQYFIEERFEYFKDERDAYYFREGDVDGFAVSGKIKQITDRNESAVQLKFRSAVSADSKKSDIYMLFLENRFKLPKKGELKLQAEFYKSNNNNTITTSESYLLTDNRPGTQGVVWSVIFRAKIKKEFRLNFTIQGRHSDINQARIFARTEFIAQF